MGQDDGAVSRRTVVIGAVVGLVGLGLAGCQGPRWYPGEVGPDEYVLRAVITEKERMIARYEAAVSAGSGPADLLQRLLDDHRGHLDALRERLPDSDGEDARPGEPAASPSPAPAPVPREGVAADALRVAEWGAADARVRQAAKVSDSGLAQLIASVGACELGHAHLLAEA
ncbi:hypothetical protein HNR23_002970 [Nocardiopsis mwathae]|uniref:Ferritin-like domain-containing protein n=1 Tax=Nocardiopsis mwathae TaxID=1472723 RepID=A0A7X0D657_9ACTN|nr:hypothetical protein [Nocardiopsis mwathae]MBB6172910.1 hypothetical protein [Nocardiopsis mwathae]